MTKILSSCAACGASFERWGEKDKKRFCSHTCGYSANRSHGLTDTTENIIWRSMKQRCHNPRKSDYPLYGARGIKVCVRWFDSFENFLADMGPRPSKDYTLDRIDNDGDYEPDNCRWATKLEQNRKRRGVSTQADDDKIREGIANGLNFKQIAALMGKPHGSITARAYRIGLRSGQPCSNFRGLQRKSSSQLTSPQGN